MTPEQMNRFQAYRKDLFEAIKQALVEDGHCKSYEGALQLNYPCYFDVDSVNEEYCISLDCYVLGPTRHYHYSGKTWDKCLDKAEKDLKAWTTPHPIKQE